MEHFIEMSRYAGMREDLVQAGGGNSSVKLESGKMLIKASGFQLTEISEEEGYAIVNPQVIIDFFNNTPNNLIVKESEKAVLNEAFISGKKPSIETFLHAITDVYTLHTHPTLVNVLTARKNGMEVLAELFPEALFVDYATPGILLAKEYFSTYSKNKKEQNQIFNIIFLKNHGVIVSDKNAKSVIDKTEEVITKIAEYLGIDVRGYKNVTKLYYDLSEVYDDKSNIVYLSDNASLLDVITEFKDKVWDYTFCPDCIVYCGKKILDLNKDFSLDDIHNYQRQYGKPVIVLLNRKIYIVAQSIKKAREVESVLSFSAQVAYYNKNYSMDLLSEEEQDFLLNWDAEKYRKNMK